MPIPPALTACDKRSSLSLIGCFRPLRHRRTGFQRALQSELLLLIQFWLDQLAHGFRIGHGNSKLMVCADAERQFVQALPTSSSSVALFIRQPLLASMGTLTPLTRTTPWPASA